MGSGGSKPHESFTIQPGADITVLPSGDILITATQPTGPKPSNTGPGTTGAGGSAGIGGAGGAGGAGIEEPIPAGTDQAVTATAEPAPQPAPDSDLPAGNWPDSVIDDALVQQQWAGREVLTPIPEILAEGAGFGAALAVGGADFADGSVTLIEYQDPNGGPSRQILTGILTPEAEEKVLDALTSPDGPTIPVLIPQDMTGRVDLDKEKDLHGQLAAVAKSINKAHKKGNEIPASTITQLAALSAQVDTLHAQALDGSVEKEMLQRYRDDITECTQRTVAGYNTGYLEGGKIEMINPFEKHGPAMVTAHVPDPAAGVEGLPVTKRTASLIQSSLSGGKSRWDGSRTNTSGTELAVDLGDGYTAVVRPSSLNPPGRSNYSVRNTIEVIGPPGGNNHHHLVGQLGRLNLVNRPMNQAEAEWTFLQRNVYAHNLEHHPAVTTALTQAAGLEQAHEQILLTQRAHLVAGMDDSELSGFARQLKLDAEADSLTDKLRILRGGVAQAMGFPDTATLTANPTYTPTPRSDKGWLTWSRIGHDHAKINAAFTGRTIFHRVTGGNLTEILLSGALVSTDRRFMAGVRPGLGMSETSDQRTGGSRGIFTRVGHGSGTRFVWDNPAQLLQRTDWYAYGGDHFGAAAAGWGNTNGQTRDPITTATFTGNNEIILANGIDLLGADAPSSIVCSTTAERTKTINALTKAGITTIGSRPLTEVIIHG